MKTKNIFYNLYQILIENFRKYVYLVVPLIFFGILKILNFNIIFNIDEYFREFYFFNILLICLLFFYYLKLKKLPQNKFLQLLKSSGYMRVINKTIFFGMFLLITTIILSLLYGNCEFIVYILLFGVLEVVVSSFHFYKILKYYYKSK
ncbi:hypothetical protein [Peptoniphilus timonensis]|uniref:hypothetical protein n=1 Tax=Peptoniphilus timonensis TaxID=1268254 RepID=UPI0005940122|nr:hypothetical protein [Peptoniphilus timonensis]